MAPVEPGAQTSNAVPLAIYGVQLLTLAGLASAVLTTVQRAARTLPPSSDTRTASPRRRRHAALLGGLALASAAVTGYFGVAARLLSYEAWARKKEQDVPGGLWTGWYGTGDGGVRWDLGGWYQDADLVREGWEATVRRSRGFWWTGQLFVGIMGWAIFVGIEGMIIPFSLSTRRSAAFTDEGRIVQQHADATCRERRCSHLSASQSSSA